MTARRLGGVTLGIACVVSGCARPHDPESAPLPVSVRAVGMAAPPEGNRYSATIQPYEQVTIAFRAAGYVQEVTRRKGADGLTRVLQPGDIVRTGAVLARVRDAEARERVGQAEAALREVEAMAERARLDVDRARTLFGTQSLTRPELDAAQAAFAAAEAQIAVGRAAVTLAQISLNDYALVAPSNAVVLERKVEVGTLVGLGSVGFVIGQIDVVKAVFGVPDTAVHRVNPGDTLNVSTDTFPGTTFSGRVSAVSPAADPQSRVFNVEVTILNRDGRLRPGMIGRVAVPGAEPVERAAARSPVVPLSSIFKSRVTPGGYAVFVVESSGDRHVAHAREVVLGDVRGNSVIVNRGLREGEQVIVTGTAFTADGAAVRPIRAEGGS